MVSRFLFIVAISISIIVTAETLIGLDQPIQVTLALFYSSDCTCEIGGKVVTYLMLLGKGYARQIPPPDF